MDRLTREELARWLRPEDTLKRLPNDWDNETKFRAIRRRLAEGHIKSTALTARYLTGASIPRTDRLCQIGAFLWSKPWNTYDHDLWIVGDVKFDNEPPAQLLYTFSPSYDEKTTEVLKGASFTGVRFEPDSFEIAFDLESIGEVEQPALDEKKKTIAAAEIECFSKLYLELWEGSATEMKALEVIRAAYPGSSIGRDVFLAKFRELRGPGKRGKPVIRGK